MNSGNDLKKLLSNNQLGITFQTSGFADFTESALDYAATQLPDCIENIFNLSNDIDLTPEGLNSIRIEFSKLLNNRILFNALNDNKFISEVECLLERLNQGNKCVEYTDERKPLKLSEINDKCVLPELNFEDIVFKLNSRKIVIDAPTGAGKTLRLAEAVTKSKKSGVILTHSNQAAEKLYQQILEFGVDPEDIVKFNFDNKSEYIEFKKNPQLFATKRWVICYSGRIFKGDMDILNDIMSKVPLMKTNTFYILSDECISNPFTISIPIHIIDALSAANEAFNEYFSSTSYREPGVKDNLYEEAIRAMKYISAKFEAGWFNDLTNPNLVNFNCSVRALRDLLISFNLSATSRSITNYELRRGIYILNKLIDYVNLYPQQFHKFRVRTFDSRGNLLKPEDKRFNFKVGIDDVIEGCTLIVFDATARLDYSGSDFTIYEPIKIKKENLIKFYKIHAEIPSDRYNSDVSEYEEFFKSGIDKIGIKDNSIVLWYNSIKDENGNIIELESYFKDYFRENNLNNCHFIAFNTSEVLGSNEFSSCDNIYILGFWHAAKEAVRGHNISTGGHMNKFNMFLKNCEQAIGRTCLRNNLKYHEDPNGEKVNVYLGELDFDQCKQIINLYGDVNKLFNVTENEDNNLLINGMVKYSRSLNTSVKDKLIEIVNYFNSEDKDFYLAKDIKDKFEIHKDMFDTYLGYLNEIGYGHIKIKKRGMDPIEISKLVS